MDPGEPASPPRTLLIKLSGEGMGDRSAGGVSPEKLDALAGEIQAAAATGARLALMLGGGNFLRGGERLDPALDRVAADRMGMLSTAINGMALAEHLRARGLRPRHLTAVPLEGWIDRADPQAARDALARGEVVVYSGGTGNPYFTTDSAGALRACEIGADLLVKATKVDGVYSADPGHDPSARRFDTLTYDEVLSRRLGVMDLTAVTLARDAGIPIVVCDLFTPGNLARLARGERAGTWVTG